MNRIISTDHQYSEKSKFHFKILISLIIVHSFALIDDANSRTHCIAKNVVPCKHYFYYSFVKTVHDPQKNANFQLASKTLFNTLFLHSTVKSTINPARAPRPPNRRARQKWGARARRENRLTDRCPPSERYSSNAIYASSPMIDAGKEQL